MARQPYSKRYPKIVRAKRITLPLAIAALLVCWVAAMGNPGSFWWLGLFMAAGVLLWAGSPTARPIKGPHGSDDDITRIMRR